MSRGRVQNLAASPTLVGAMTVLIVVVAVFLAYNANQGLPFVPTYRLSADVPNANTLVPGNEVRIGGVRVGAVDTVEPEQHEDGSVSAKLDLTLDRAVMPLPEDSTMVIRSRSALGLKYLEIRRGVSEEGFAEGSTIPLAAARPEPVEIDELFNTFDEPTRNAIKTNLLEFGNALAARGGALNQTIGNLPLLLSRLEPVARSLAAPSTELDRFVSALAAAAGEAAPVAEQQASMFVALERTFAAFARVSRPYVQETISKSPPTMDVAIDTLPRIRPFLANTAGLFADLRPGIAAIRPAAPVLADATVIGTDVLRASPPFNRQIPPTAEALRRFNDNATARNGINRLIQLGQIFNPGLSFITPAQSVCNYATILFRNTSDLFRYGNNLGNWQLFRQLDPPNSQGAQPYGPNNEGLPSSGPAAGPQTINYLHSNPYPNTAAPGQPFECEAGNEPYAVGRRVIGNVPGNQGIRTGGQTAAQRAGKTR